ncbi:MAG: XdhC family protein [Hyphomicrobiales bacterium]
MDARTLAEINAARQERRAVVVVTDIATGEQRLLHAGAEMEDELRAEVEQRLKSGKSGVVSLGDGENFIQVHVPSPRLVIIGAVHISQALVPMAQACGFDVLVIDPRTAFATEERFPSVELRAEWPQEILPDRPLDAYTALVAVTHDPKIDDMPLQSALKHDCFYIGALGSRKTHAKRVSRFEEAGFAASDMERIHAPIGLDIRAASPAEIAVSVMAEIIETLRKGPPV